MTLASVLLKVTITLALALGAARLARRNRAAVRHLLLAAAFAVLLVMPFAAMAIPSVRMELPAAIQGAAVWADVESGSGFTSQKTGVVPVATAAIATDPDRSPSRSVSLAIWGLGLWIVGVLACVAPAIIGLIQLRALRRSGLPWRQGQAIVDEVAQEVGLGGGIQLLFHESSPGPMTCGVWRPAVILPPDALAWSAAELNRTIVHELEHVRRRDWLSQCVARFVCAVYWFHPLIWIAHRQLALEAERACDDAVLWRAEATDYADQLVALAKRISISARQSAPAMASRSDLAARVGAVLDSHQRRGRAGATWVIAAFAVSAFIAAAVSPLTIVAIGQAVTGKFEVASVKPCTTGEILPTGAGGARGGGYGGGRFGTSPDTLTVTCMTVEEMTHLAYAASGNPLLNDPRRPNELRVEGGPEWVYKDRWSVEAKAAAPAERRVITGAMLQSLLEGRFQLQQHRGTQQEQMYGLVAAKSGMKIRPIEPGGCVNRATASAEQKGDLATFFCGTMTNVDEGRVTIRIGGTTLARFASVLSGYADRAVIDKTGLTGLFNITIAFAPMTAPPSETSAEPLVSALERQLGLKLEPARGPAEHLVIDRVEKPRIN